MLNPEVYQKSFFSLRYWSKSKLLLQVPSDNESSTPSQPTKIIANGHLQGSEKNETRLKQILESKRLNRQNKENVDNSGAKADLRQQLDKQYPEPPSPDQTVHTTTFLL